MKPQETRLLIKRVVDESKMPQAVLAQEAGISYDTIRAWLAGRRSPSVHSLQQLAAAIRRRSLRLNHLADELEHAAKG